MKRLENIKNSVSQASRIAKLTNKDFIFNFTSATTGVSRGTGGRLVSASASNFPGAIGNGVAMTIGYLGPCAMNLPHTHPRATEINFSVKGTFQVGFKQENAADFIMNTVGPGVAAIFPQGAVHFEQNLDCTPAIFVAAFNSEDPGVLTVADAFFGALPATIVGASLGGLNIATVNDIRKSIPANPSIGIQECKKRCGLA
ncbi:unnamed protein product [Rotaria sordida]|uniref:Cupin type-1 domain-containing protein n=1 Tax=Rotaria sordida TaxID=392033 RepID=A0A819C2J4_9BILA|nr:unnamed protein product [Rotaria sordida]CAF0841654.1 unnamed protein product [Rotaria sordida]CAF0878024.1 unnamed protein product [Rotaria sordida]CAF3702148.1 unnamed protein product [Rotaria sordida]CAF3734393.1 unnamed protein product [Rotaria sordida]